MIPKLRYVNVCVTHLNHNLGRSYVEKVRVLQFQDDDGKWQDVPTVEEIEE